MMEKKGIWLIIMLIDGNVLLSISKEIILDYLSCIFDEVIKMEMDFMVNALMILFLKYFYVILLLLCIRRYNFNFDLIIYEIIRYSL